MIEVGKYNEMEVVKHMDFGIYLRKDDVEVLLPHKWVPKGTQMGDILDVFVFRDSDDRLIATTVEPYAISGEFAFLEAKQVNNFGAFLDYCEIHLDRRRAEKRVYPSILINKSGTRREELLLKPEILQKTWILRKLLYNMDEIEAMEFILDKMKSSKNNLDFFDMMRRGG